MSIFYEFGSWVMGGLRRMAGVQYSYPTYTEEAASPVTFDSAMQLSAVWACVKLLAETPASLPLHFYRRTEDGSRVADPEHDLAVLFAGKVNRYQNRVEFWETVLLNLLTQGNSYCQIERRGGRIVSLMPLMSAQMETRLLSDGSISYQYNDENHGVTVFAEKSIWHLKLMGNSITGLSPLAYQRNTLGIAQAAEKAVSNVYRNGAKPSGVLKLDRLLTKQQRDEVRTAFANLTTGDNNRLMVLEKGTDFQAISLSPQDIELLSSRKFQISEICRWYGVPSVLVNDNNGTTTWGSGIEQIMQGFYKLTLRPLLEKIEASMVVNLLSPEDRRSMDIEFDFNALLRSDIKTMFESYKSAVNGSLMTPNEARKELNLQPVEAGDKLFLQGAMVPIEQLGQQMQPQQPIGQENGNEIPQT
jgi:HK97 family phage portal protein